MYSGKPAAPVPTSARNVDTRKSDDARRTHPLRGELRQEAKADVRWDEVVHLAPPFESQLPGATAGNLQWSVTNWTEHSGRRAMGSGGDS